MNWRDEIYQITKTKKLIINLISQVSKSYSFKNAQIYKNYI